MAKKSISFIEPADRPITITLSLAELNSLVRYHCSKARKIPPMTGKYLIKNPGGAKDTIKAAKEMVDAHMKRANDLQAILRGHLES